MDENVDDIDNLFRKAVESHPDIPGDGVWSQLEKTLQKRNVSAITKKYKKWKWFSLLLILFSTGIGIYTVHLTWKYKKETSGFIPGVSSSNKSHDTSARTSLSSNKTIPANKVTAGKVNIIGKAGDGKGKKLTQNDNRYVNNKKTALEITSATTENPTKKKATIFKTSIFKIASNNAPKPFKSELEKIITAVDDDKVATLEKVDELVQLQNRSDSRTQLPADDRLSNYPGRIDTSNRVLSREKIDLKASLISFIMPFTSKPLIKLNSIIISPIHLSRLKTRKIYNDNFIAGIFYGMNVPSTILEANHPDYREDNYLQIKNHEKSGVSRSLGLTITGQIRKKWGIGSGLIQNTFETDVTNKPLVARKDNSGKINYRISTSAGYAYYAIKNRPLPSIADSITTVSSKISLTYLSVPLSLQYNFYNRKFLFSPSVSFYINFKSSGKITTIQSAEHTYTGNLEGLKSHYAEVALGLSIGYYINKSIIIKIVPSIRRPLSPITVKDPVITRFNAAGIGTGLYFAF
jgi:hypothetical protein